MAGPRDLTTAALRLGPILPAAGLAVAHRAVTDGAAAPDHRRDDGRRARARGGGPARSPGRLPGPAHHAGGPTRGVSRFRPLLRGLLALPGRRGAGAPRADAARRGRA